MVKINSGPVEATDKFYDTPKDKWRLLLIAKRSFLGRRLEHDCRCLIEFCEEAKAVYSDLEFASAEEMIRDGYELDPSQIELAVAWLNTNGMDRPVPMAEALAETIVKIEAMPDLPKLGEIGNGRKPDGRDNNVISTRQGNDTEYTLRRIKRDAPELLEAIKRGELSVNAAAIKAGIRKKPTAYEIALKAAKKLSVDERKSLIKELSNEV